MEYWKQIDNFDDYSVSTYGRVRSDRTNRILALSINQYGVVHVGLMRDGMQHHRSVPRLVAKAFLPPYDLIVQEDDAFAVPVILERNPFDTPINLDGNRLNNNLDNLAWRPRWFAIKYNWQFRYPSSYHISNPIIDLKTREVSANSFKCAKTYGLLEEDLVVSILNRTYVWPTYQEFGIFED